MNVASRIFSVILAMSTLVPNAESFSMPSYAFDANSREDVRRLCNAVSEQLRSHDGKPLHALLFEAGARVLDNDADERKKAKIQGFWLQARQKLTCVQMGFSLTNGSIVKLAIESNNADAIADFTRRWNLDMNFSETVDGLTPLDFVDQKISEAPNSNLIIPWRRYRELLTRFGAKRSSEL